MPMANIIINLRYSTAPNFWTSFSRCHERAKRLETQFESVAGSDAGAVAKNGQKAEQFFPVTLGKRPTSLSGTYKACYYSNLRGRIWQSKLCLV